MNKKNLKDITGIIGKQTVSIYNMASKKAMEIEHEINTFLLRPNAERLSEKGRAYFLSLIAELERISKVREYVTENLIVTVGRAVIAQRLASITTNTGIINYGALGTSATAASNGQTQLVAEVFRKIVASASSTTNVAFVDFFYSKADTNGTYQEFGSFIDGTGTANSGVMFTRVVTGGWTKTSSESMTVACQYTVN